MYRKFAIFNQLVIQLAVSQRRFEIYHHRSLRQKAAAHNKIH